MLNRNSRLLLFVLTLTLLCGSVFAGTRGLIGANVVLNTAITKEILLDLSRYGKVRDQIPQINALTMQIRKADLATLQSLPYVAAVNADQGRTAGPVDTVSATDFENGLSTWNLDAINVTVEPGSNEREVAPYDGTGVYVAVLDTGLVKDWRQYFPEERIAEEYAIAFGGGGGLNGTVSRQPKKWARDTNSHGTHVTSTILGYNLLGTPINGVAPQSTVIPVKVLNQPGFGWSSVIARGIVYIGDLKANELSDHPVVINMSLSGGVLDAVEKAAVDYAISQGVIIVAAAGNTGEAGMGYPGAYEPVISVAAAGWDEQWTVANNWWLSLDVPEPTDGSDFHIVAFSAREKTGQDLDLAAPGSWVVGPYETSHGKATYFYLSGTSMASPHVAGTVALMAQKKNDLDANEADTILESTAIPIPPGTETVALPPLGSGAEQTFTWGNDATGAGLVDAEAALSATP